MPAKPKSSASTHAAGFSSKVDERIQTITTWHANTLIEVRRLIHEALPQVEEDCKWAKANNPLGVPTWSLGGIICTGEVYQRVVKLTFARGASLFDPQQLFNASLDGGTRRAIDLVEGATLDAVAFKALVQDAAAANQAALAEKKQR